MADRVAQKIFSLDRPSLFHTIIEWEFRIVIILAMDGKRVRLECHLIKKQILSLSVLSFGLFVISQW